MPGSRESTKSRRRNTRSNMYKPSTAKFAGRTTTYYIQYNIGARRHIKRVYISGKLRSSHIGVFSKRSGKRVHGVEFIYINPIAKGAGRGGRIKKMQITKIVAIPKAATDVKITRKKPKHGVLRID